MSITVNNGSSLHELSDISVNIGGTLHSLDRITVNEGGVLREIFAKATSGELPTSLTWSVDTTISEYDTASKISTVSDDGLTIKYQSKSANETNTNFGASCICSNVFDLPSGASVIITPISLSGSGTSADVLWAHLYNTNGSLIASGSTHNNSGGMQKITFTAPENSKYQIRLGGYSLTGGQSSVYYTATVSAAISFSM